MSVIQMRGAKEAPRSERHRMETMLLTPDVINQWRIPPFQRPLRVNKKVSQIAEALKTDGGIIGGIISLGTVGADTKTLYVYDGQHRLEAARISGLQEFIADVGIRHFDTMIEMGIEFVELNTAIVKMNPDDKLRGLEGSLPELQRIRKHCPFVGYGQVRRNNTNSPTLSMSVALRCWLGSQGDTPVSSVNGKSSLDIARDMSQPEAEALIQFLNVVRAAWGSDHSYARLWGALNLTMCMWLWRQIVMKKELKGGKKHVLMTAMQFGRCMMSVSAATEYIEWLVGRQMTERDRGPAFGRLKTILLRRLREDGHAKAFMPSPAWSTQ